MVHLEDERRHREPDTASSRSWFAVHGFDGYDVATRPPRIEDERPRRGSHSVQEPFRFLATPLLSERGSAGDQGVLLTVREVARALRV